MCYTGTEMSNNWIFPLFISAEWYCHLSEEFVCTVWNFCLCFFFFWTSQTTYWCSEPFKLIWSRLALVALTTNDIFMLEKIKSIMSTYCVKFSELSYTHKVGYFRLEETMSDVQNCAKVWSHPSFLYDLLLSSQTFLQSSHFQYSLCTWPFQEECCMLFKPLNT